MKRGLLGFIALCGCFVDTDGASGDAASSDTSTSTGAATQSSTTQGASSQSTSSASDSAADTRDPSSMSAADDTTAVGTNSGPTSSSGGEVSLALLDLYDQACGGDVEWIGTRYPDLDEEPLICDGISMYGGVVLHEERAVVGGTLSRVVEIVPPDPRGSVQLKTAAALGLAQSNGPIFVAHAACVEATGDAVWELGLVQDDGGSIELIQSGMIICADGIVEIDVELPSDEDRILSLVVAWSGAFSTGVAFGDAAVVADE